MSKLLINESPLVLLPSLAKNIGLNQAIVIQQIHYWLQTSKTKINGQKWVYNTIDEWLEQFPFFSRSTLERTISSLIKDGFLVVEKLSGFKSDRTNYYTIDYVKLNEPLRQNDVTITSNCGNGNVNLKESTIPSNCGNGYTENTKTTTKTTTDISCRDVAIADTATDISTKVEPTKKQKLTPQETEANKATWTAYATAYKNRYGVEPLRNAQVNGIISKFVKAVGQEDAPSIARFFINISNQFYIQKLHTVKLLIADADAIRTQWLTNRTVTASQARQADTMQTAKSAVDGVLERRAKRQAEAEAAANIINGECTHV